MNWRAAFAVAFTIGLLALGLGAGAEPAFSARTQDGRVHFSITENTVHTAFTAFCASREAEGRCDRFEKYRFEVGVVDALVAISFIHRGSGHLANGGLPLLSFGCLWIRGERQCHSGDHHY